MEPNQETESAEPAEKVVIQKAKVEIKATDIDPSGLKDQLPKTPTTTAQEDLIVAGQRRINLIWEYTQAIIAVIVVLCNMIAALFNVFNQRNIDVPMILSSALFLIVGFYFSRTNHQAIGGVGEKANEDSSQTYKGR